MKKKAAFLCLFLFGAGLYANAQTKTGFHLLKTHRINSDGGWDYISVDPIKHRIYIAHGNQVNILNELTGDSAGVIPNTVGVHGIAVVSSFGKGYTSNGKLGTCTVFDLNSNETNRQINVGENPDALFYDDFSKKVIVFNGRGRSASVINPVNDQVVATIPLGGKPEAGVSDGKGTIFVNLEDKNEIVAFDSKTFKIKKRYPLKKGQEPSGLSIDRISSRLFAVCSNRLMVIINAKNGHEIDALPIGGECDGVVFDHTSKIAYTANGDGTITVIKEVNPNLFKVVENIKTAAGARTIALDPLTHHLFLPTADFETAKAQDIRPLKISKTFRVLELGK